MFVVQTPRTRIIAMSISGSRLRTSTAIQAMETSTPAATSPTVFADPHPHFVVLLIASRISEIPTVIRIAASQFTRPGTRIGDSGTQRQVASAAATIATSGIQNSQW